MAQLTRIIQKIFGGGSSQNGQFGSAQLGTPTLSNDPSVIQGLPAWEQGWNSATISGDKLPALEEVQGVDYVVTRQLAYLFQAGIPEWIATETYYEGSIARDSTGAIYKSLQDNNLNHALTDPVWWDSAVTAGVPDGVYGDITVSGSGTVWTVNNGAIDANKLATDAVTTNKVLAKNITFPKVQDVATRTIAGRTTAGTGSLEQVPFIDDDTMATATANNVASAESVKAYVDSKKPVIATAVTASGTAVQFTGIPSTVKRIKFLFWGLSSTGTSQYRIQIGSTTYTTSGYVGACTALATGNAATDGIGIFNNAAANILNGIVEFINVSGNTWVASGNYAYGNTGSAGNTGGYVTLGGTLDRIQLTTSGGTDTFDAGSVTIEYS